ncbi:MAG: N-acetyltransferase [Pseudomonadota bacterium]
MTAKTGERAVIRLQRADDREAVVGLNDAAFGGELEGRIVTRLWASQMSAVSLVAELAGEIVGHIMFSPLTVETRADPPAAIDLLGLGPMSVAPGLQRQGLGSRLVTHGVEWCQRQGVAAVCVLGHPEFYPRFGFTPASRFGLACVYQVPDPVFMALELVPGRLDSVQGTVHYAPAFSIAEA